MAATANFRLDRRFDANYDFTHSDMVMLTFIDIITFPIKAEHIDYMAIYNYQCYDSDDFDCYKKVNTSVSEDGLTVGTLGIPRLRICVHERMLITGKTYTNYSSVK